MKGIGQFFDKFKNGALKEIQKREIICALLKSELGFDIPVEKISFGNKTLLINEGQMVKAEIFLKKQKILDRLHKQLPNLIINDIR
jgi:hypothetical protein